MKDVQVYHKNFAKIAGILVLSASLRGSITAIGTQYVKSLNEKDLKEHYSFENFDNTEILEQGTAVVNRNGEKEIYVINYDRVEVEYEPGCLGLHDGPMRGYSFSKLEPGDYFFFETEEEAMAFAEGLSISGNKKIFQENEKIIYEPNKTNNRK